MQLLSPLKIYLFASALLVITTGILVLSGWQFNVEVLKRLLIQSESINPTSSIGLILAGVSFMLLFKDDQKAQFVVASKVLSLAIISIAGLKLTAHFNLHNITIDKVFFTATNFSVNFLSGKMPLNSAFGFLLIGLSLFLLGSKKIFTSQFFSFLAAFIAFLSLIGYVHFAPDLSFPFQNSFITPAVAICFLILSISMLLSRKSNGYMAEILSNYNGGKIARRLLPMFLIVPIVLEMFHYYGVETGLYSLKFGNMLLFCAIFSIALYMVLTAVKLANKTDLRLEEEIIERKNHEQERELLIQELTKHNEDLRQFSYITSHNLRAPLSNLLGLLSLVKVTPIEDQHLKEILEGFNVSTNSLNDTINDLLRVLCIKENTAIDQEEVLVAELFNKIFAQVSNQINEIEPEIEIDIAKNSTIHFNRAYLESIFLNLLTNAIKYRSPNRQLKLIIKLVEYGPKSVVTFHDNGIGINLEKHGHKLFGLYQRFHNHPDSKGLGLYLVKTQVEALGGKIDIESTEDVGTKFTLTFNKLYAEQSFFH